MICIRLFLKIWLRREKKETTRKSFQAFCSLKVETQIEDSRRCDLCIIDVHRESYAKFLKIKKHWENINQENLNILERLLREHKKNLNIIPRWTSNPKASKNK